MDESWIILPVLRRDVVGMFHGSARQVFETGS